MLEDIRVIKALCWIAVILIFFVISVQIGIRHGRNLERQQVVRSTIYYEPH